MKNMNMYREVYSPINPFDDEACNRLLRKELNKQIYDNRNLKFCLSALKEENEKLKIELNAQKERNDISSAYPKPTFGLVYQECKIRPTFVIDKALFNPPATIVFWLDGTKTVVKCKEGEEFSEWAGIALCLAKKMYGPNFHKIFRAHCSDPEKTVNDMSDSEITKAARQAIKGMHEASEQSKNLFEEFLNELERNFPWTDAK